MSTTEITTEEMFESLTGFDEIAISNHFGGEVMDLSENKPMTFIRALVFVQERRNGSKDSDAKQKAMELTVKEITNYFTEDDEPMPEEPVTDSGKGDEPAS